MTLQDLRAIRVPLIIFIIALLAGAGMVQFSKQVRDDAHARLEQLQLARTLAQQRVAKSDGEKSLIVRYLSDYQRLQQQGFIGQEQRINWLDTLRIVNQELKLFNVEYTISAQQTYSGEPKIDSGPFQLHQSLMKLNLSLLHEEDLLRFLKRLSAQKAGLFTINECALQRAQAALQTPTNQANLLADCTLAWFTIDAQTPLEKMP